jgi:V-type H+-transporting ATPase subunit a
MKFAVIIGVIHMLFGIFLKGVNAVYFKNSVDIIFEFIPQVIFMSILFGYMVVMIFMKWSIAWDVGSVTAPSIVTMLMNVFLGMGSLGGDVTKGYTPAGEPILTPVQPLFGEPHGAQENFHFWILVISGICVPIMLFPKPIILYLRDRNSQHGFDKFIEEVIILIFIIA